MKKIDRINKPKILINKEVDWTRELLGQISLKASYSNVEDKYKNRYRHKEVKEQLENMFMGKCCYCESYIGDTDYEHIEHFKPKSIFPEESFKWENLFWSCGICNNNKRDKWDESCIFINPVDDTPSAHLQFLGGLIDGLSDRGVYTINELDLNREKLIKARQKVLLLLLEIIIKIKRTEDPVEKENIKNRLKGFIESDCEYTMMCNELIEDLLN